MAVSRAVLLCLLVLPFVPGLAAGEALLELYPAAIDPGSTVRLELDRLQRRLSERGLSAIHVGEGCTPETIGADLDVIDRVAALPGLVTGDSAGVLPVDLRVSFHGALFGGGSYFGGRMEIAHQVELTSGERVGAEESRAAIAHEYGHALFDSLMARVDPTYAEVVKSRRLFFDLRARIDREAARDPSSPEVDRLIAESRQVVQSRSLAVSRMHDVLLPYNELFADVVAVLAMKDGQALTRVIDSDKSIRDFAASHPVEGWDRTEHYDAMAPARAALGREYGLARGRLDPQWGSPGRFLHVLIQAIQRHHARTLAAQDYALEPGNVPEAVRGLLEHLTEELRTAPRH